MGRFVGILDRMVRHGLSVQVTFEPEAYLKRQKKRKHEQVGPHQTKKFLHSKKNSQQDGKATYGAGEHTCKPHIQSEVNIQNI